ncbi:LytTR family transcriptional regulator DNA-binding domain-containing protein [Bacillus sp. S/N-304-OC-R1]|uniref:LytTR family transcriptional regulator DNA-binding domain-containing protein n=1 Tax=Bacillus sp. S/N-304-OC-R1 TaxID=2758034 RepID=UPI001C8E4900|nr:LytTR family transcriptional regulator DNA-binding domain-containing protein [Bacillus sp. S/N-304-OC-R1]MBY0122215.1 LytTR family transcriptional regulator DNA-binding domain-containing protein [Bacillus sp. S/N-304-OC-R1]
MSILLIKDLEKHVEHTLVFPAFSLEVSKSEVAAIHSNTNVRSVLLQLLIGEMPITDGVIVINGQKEKQNRKKYLRETGFFSLEDALYERLSVKDNLSFYKKLFDSELSLTEVLQMVGLETKENVRFGKLTYSEKRRAHFGRLLYQNPSLYVFEEPDQNIDLETKRVFLKIVEQLKKQGKAVLILTSNMETALSVTNRVYRLDERGLLTLDVISEDEHAKEAILTEDAKQTDEEIIIQPVRFEKIPTKVNDKIVLFDPPEIDYIESSDGQSNIFIKGEMYPSVFTMSELEQRLHPYGFFRCHRSYIVNLQKVREVVTWTRNSFTLVLGDVKKSSIPLSKTKMAELKGMLGLK